MIILFAHFESLFLLFLATKHTKEVLFTAAKKSLVYSRKKLSLFQTLMQCFALIKIAYPPPEINIYTGTFHNKGYFVEFQHNDPSKIKNGTKICLQLYKIGSIKTET